MGIDILTVIRYSVHGDFYSPLPSFAKPSRTINFFLTPSLLELPLPCFKLQARRKEGRKNYTCTTVPWRLFSQCQIPFLLLCCPGRILGKKGKKRQGGREQERRKEPPFLFWTVLENWHPLNEKSFLLCGQKKSSTILLLLS